MDKIFDQLIELIGKIVEVETHNDDNLLTKDGIFFWEKIKHIGKLTEYNSKTKEVTLEKEKENIICMFDRISVRTNNLNE